MATLNKKHRKKLEIKDDIYYIEDVVITFDPTEPVSMIAYGYKKDKNHGKFTTLFAPDRIAAIVCEHRSDDEIITIRYKNGGQETHDGSDCRIMDFDVYSELFLTEKEIYIFIQDHLQK